MPSRYYHPGPNRFLVLVPIIPETVIFAFPNEWVSNPIQFAICFIRSYRRIYAFLRVSGYPL